MELELKANYPQSKNIDLNLFINSKYIEGKLYKAYLHAKNALNILISNQNAW